MWHLWLVDGAYCNETNEMDSSQTGWIEGRTVVLVASAYFVLASERAADR